LLKIFNSIIFKCPICARHTKDARDRAKTK